MAEGLLIRLTHSGSTTQSVLVHDIHDGTDGDSKAGPVYVPAGGEAELLYTADVARSFESGVIRGLIDNGFVTATVISGDAMGAATGRVFRFGMTVAGDSNVSEYLVVPSDGKLLSVTAFAASAPASALGSYFLTIIKDPNGDATPLLAGAGLNLESLVDFVPSSATLTATTDDLSLSEGDVVQVLCTSDNADLTGSGLHIQLQLS